MQPQSSPSSIKAASRRSRSVSGSQTPKKRMSLDLSEDRNESHLIAPARRTVEGTAEPDPMRSRSAAGSRPINSSSPPVDRWESALKNVEEAKSSFDVIAHQINDAIYLDEEAYNQVAPVMQFTTTIQGQQRRIEALEAQLRETKYKLEESNAIQTEALKRHADMQQELENNAVVFNMHYQELLKKEEEISKLNDLVEILSQQS